jgi:hypothetical protein
MAKVIKSAAVHLRPMPEYRSSKPWHSSYSGPPFAPMHGPPLPEAIELARSRTRDAEVMEAVRRDLAEQFGAAAVFVSYPGKD